MQGTDFDEVGFFRAVEGCGARALLIGRRALVVLGLPVLTADYDFWLHIDDIDAFNRAAARFSLAPTHAPDEARLRGRYALENDEHVDVLVARSVPTIQGDPVAFADLWNRRQATRLAEGVHVQLPSLADLIVTKRFASRPKAWRAVEEAQRQVTGAEAAAYLAAPISEAEREEALALVRWFRRRYPTGAARLAYVRRAYRRWTLSRPQQ